MLNVLTSAFNTSRLKEDAGVSCSCITDNCLHSKAYYLPSGYIIILPGWYYQVKSAKGIFNKR